MQETPVDAWHAWIGLSVASLAFLGLAVDLPRGPPPDAAEAADTIDAVAASEYPATARHPTGATALRVRDGRIALRDDAGTSHAALSYGRVVFAGDGPLGRVLDGVDPRRAFDSPAAFRRAVAAADGHTPTWHRLDGDIRVRKVVWGEVNVTLVGS